MADISVLFSEVFEENGEMKACRRDKCIELMEALQEKYPGVDFGNPKTGFLNLSVVRSYFFKNKEPSD